MRSAIIGALALFSSVDGPQPLAALERTPRPATLAFGEGGPDAVALSAALVSTIGCGESGWCAELRPEHFATASNIAFSRRAAPYKGKVPPVVVGQQVAPRSAALPRAADFLPFVTVCTHYVFAIREGGALRPSKHGTNCAALAAAWTKGVQGFPTEWPSAAVVRAQLGWRPAQPDVAHLVILLTDAGWFAAARQELGELGVLQMDGGEVQTRLVFERTAITALRTIGGLGTSRRATARRGTAARRVRRLPCPADDVPATQMVVAARRDSQAPFGHRRSS